MTELAALLNAASAGARSVGVRGWLRDECEAAARERVARLEPRTTLDAYRAGRAAAVDELRTLTHWRRGVHAVTVSMETEHEAEHDDYADVDGRDVVDRWLARLEPRAREIVDALLAGETGREVARRMAVDPSRVTQLLRRTRERYPWPDRLGA